MSTRPPLSPFTIAGGFVFLSGCLPRDPETGRMVAGDVREQTRIVLSQVERALADAGSSLGDVVRVGVYLADVDNDFAGFNEVYRDFFAEPFPARTTVGVSLREALVEVDAIATVGASA